MKRLLAAACFAGALTPAPSALACSLVNWNEYADFANRNSPTRVLERSATVDWVRIEASEPVCQPTTSYVEGEEPPSGACGGIDEPAPTPFVAVLRERLKGKSPDRFTLVNRDRTYSLFPGSLELENGWRLFADMRSAGPQLRFWSAVGLKQDADNRHRSLAFWDAAELRISGYGTPGMCAPVAAVEPAMSYLVFRDAAGAVIAMEPVLHDDDELLRRLRLYAPDATAFGRRELQVEDYFHRVLEAGVVRIESCRREHKGYEGEKAVVRLLRGDIGPLDSGNAEEDVSGPLRRYDFLWDYFEARRETCRRGTTLLVLRGPIFEGGGAPADRAWGLSVAPDVPNDFLAMLDAPQQIDPAYEPEEFRPIIVRNGRVRTADLLTGLTLTGPETVSVDEVFRWIEEGAAARAAAKGA